MKMSMGVVFENTYFLAVDKPAGWLSVPSREGGSDPRPCAGIELQKIHGRLFPVHRLDFEVSGLILFARTPEAQREASGWFESHGVQKIYEAWTEGAPPREWKPGHSETWKLHLQRGKKRAFESPHGKAAITVARWMGLVHVAAASARAGEALAWRLEPKTGRPHQLRVTLAKHGFPILGDALYGATRKFPRDGIALRAVKLAFPQNAFDLPAAIEVPALSAYAGG